MTAGRDLDREQRLHSRLLELAHDAVIVREPVESRVVFWNREAEAVYGYSAFEADGRVTHDLLQTGFPQSREAVDEALESVGHWAGDLRHVRKDGSVIVVSSRQALVRDEDGRASAIIELNSDVTELRASEGEHERERERLAQAAEYGADAIISIDQERRLRHWNRGAERMLGLTPDEAAGREFGELIGLDADKLIWAQDLIASVLAGGAACECETRLRRSDGTMVEVLGALTPWRVDGRLVGVTAVLRDVTERSRAEQATARLAAIVEASDDAIFRVTRDGVIESWNPGAARLYGRTAAEAIGQSIRILAPGASTPNLVRALGGETVRVDSRAVRSDGTIVEVDAMISPIRNGDAIVGAACVVRDVGERKRADQAAARLAAIVESSDAIIGETLGGEITSWNAGAQRLYGYDAAETVGRDVSMLVSPERRQELSDLLARVAAGERVSNLETTRRRRDGRLIDVSVTVSPILDQSGYVVGASSVARDISEHKRSERAREQALADLQEAQQIARVGSWTWDPGKG